MSDLFLRVPRPRLLGARRAGTASPAAGDEATAEVQPGLAALLALRDAAGRRLGEGLGLEWWIGLGAAAAAAIHAGREERGWLGIGASIDWLRASRPDEALRARAVVERVTPARFSRAGVTFGFEVVGGAGDEVVARGTLVMGTSLAAASAAVASGEAPAPAASGAGGPPCPPAAARPIGLRLRELAAAVLPPFAYRGLRRLYRRALRRQPRPAVPLLRWVRAPRTLALGEASAFEIEVTNDGTLPPGVEAVLELPFGFGLTARWASPSVLDLRPGESARLSALVEPLRPHEVNLGRPWPLACLLQAGERRLARLETAVEVEDPEPGRVFYVLTEDCETFDGGPSTGDYGGASVLGNANGFMDPEEYRLQMVEKPAALNRIADAHGARFTHFWTTTQLSAAEWACGQSATGAWPRIVSELLRSVRAGCVRHEYAPHIHFDFEPDSRLPPQPRLRYDPRTDGLLPAEYYDPISNRDHRYHGWDGARRGIAYVKRLGDLADPDSKSGSLRRATRRLARLCGAYRQPLLTRTGACDFGSSPEDLDASFRALEANGLLADADAGIYEQATPHPRGRQLYFCRRSNLEAEIETLRDAGCVQLRGPERQIENSSLGELNAWFDRRLAESAGPGVRAVMAMMHAMFMRGEPDPFRDTSGGDFEKLDRHLDHVRRAHPRVRFATASEAVVEFLDYYSPILRAVVTAPAGLSPDGRALLYPIRILGRGIPVSPTQPMRVCVNAPLAFDAEELASLTVFENGAAIASASPRGPDLGRLEFLARGREGYVLEVRSREDLPESLRPSSREADAPPPSDPDSHEDAILDLLGIGPPYIVQRSAADEAIPRTGDRWEWVFPAGLFQLLVHPIAGQSDPLARRLHPYGWAPLGMAVHACQRVLPGSEPRHAELRWLRPVSGSSDFRLRLRLEETLAGRATLSVQFLEATALLAQMRLTLDLGGPASGRAS